jgi:feruloyl esterase
MNGPGRSSGGGLAAKVRRASSHKGPWPRVQVWHGSADRTVAPSNGDAIARQWAELHGRKVKPDRTDQVSGHPRHAWLGEDGAPLVEQYVITGMAHGIPLNPGTGGGEAGEVGPHMLDVGLSSTDRIVAFFGISSGVAPRSQTAPHATRHPPRPRAPARPEPANEVQAVIENALRAAGLMR